MAPWRRVRVEGVALLAFFCFSYLWFEYCLFPLECRVELPSPEQEEELEELQEDLLDEKWPYSIDLPRVRNTNLFFSDAVLDDLSGVHRNLVLLGTGNAPKSCLYCRLGEGLVVPATLVSHKTKRGTLLWCPLDKLGNYSADHLRRIVSRAVLLRRSHTGTGDCPRADVERWNTTRPALRIADVPFSTQVALPRASFNATASDGVPDANNQTVPQEGPTSKKGFLCICTRIWEQQEADGIPPWLEYHLLVGVEHFFVYFSRLNASTLHMQLAPYVEAGLLTLVPWEKPFDDKPLALHQVLAVNHCLQVYARPSFTWALLSDVDEYVRTFDQNDTLPAIIQRKGYRNVIVLNNCDFSQRVFDGNQTGLVLDHYRERMVEPCSSRIKVLMKSNIPMLWDIHRALAPMQSLPSTDVRLNHYSVTPRTDRTAHRNKTEDHMLADRFSQRLRQLLEQRLGPSYSPPPLVAYLKNRHSK